MDSIQPSPTTAQVITLPTRPALRRALAQLDREQPSPGALAEARALLKSIKVRFADLADVLANGINDPIIEPDAPCDYETIKTMFSRYSDSILLERHIWLNGLLSRLRAGQSPTIDDRRILSDVRGRIRTATP